jgi:hypothetical protein
VAHHATSRFIALQAGRRNGCWYPVWDTMLACVLVTAATAAQPCVRRVTSAQLVDLVDEHQRVAGAHGLQCLHHLAGHGAHICAAVALQRRGVILV